MASEEVILGQVERDPVGHLHCGRRMFVLPQGRIPFLLIPWIGNKQTLGIISFWVYLGFEWICIRKWCHSWH